MVDRRFDFSLFLAGPFALSYGIAFYLASAVADLMPVLALSFICGMPIVIGIATVVFAPSRYRISINYGIFMPWVFCLAVGLLTVITGFELAVCVLMAMPISFTTSSFAGFFTVSYFRRKQINMLMENRNLMLAIITVLPFIAGNIENRLPASDIIRTVEHDIVIQADAETIWQNIIAVPEIQPEERSFSWLTLIGFPEPVQAVLSHEGIGGMRHAVYDNGLTLLEPITEWEPYERYAFGVQLDPENLPSAPYDGIGGTHFEVLKVGFILEPVSDTSTRLRLQTTYRLTTHFNRYGSMWVDFFMGDLQNSILHVIKGRAES